MSHRRWAAEAFALLAGVIQTGTYTLAQNLPLELREHREQTRHRATCWRGQVKCFGERYESDSEMLEFLERRNQVCDGPAPAIQAPHEYDVDFAPAGGSDQPYAQLALGRARSNLFDLRGDGPAALGRVFAHGADLQWQCLLVVRGNAGV